jgi:hypothetical protein
MTAVLGGYVPEAWSNGSTKLNTITMTKITDQIKAIDDDCNKSRNFNWLEWSDYFWQKNNLDIDTCQTGFSARSDTTVSQDGTNTFISDYATKALCSSSSTGGSVYPGAYKAISKDCTKFNDLVATSATSDYIIWTFYVSDKTKLDSISLHLGTNASNSHRYNFVAADVANGWNTKQLAKSAFSDNGTPPAWSAITYILFEYHVPNGVNGQNSYITSQYIGMCRKHPSSSKPWIFQEYNGSAWQVVANFDQFDYAAILVSDTTGTPSLTKPMLHLLDKVNDYYALQLTGMRRDFYLKGYVMCKNAGNVCGFTWRADSNNWVEVYYESNTCYMQVQYNGSGTNYSISFGGTIAKHSKLNINFYKTNGIIRVKFSGNSIPLFLECADPFSATTGAIYFASPGTTVNGAMVNCIVSNDAYILAESGYSVV